MKNILSKVLFPSIVLLLNSLACKPSKKPVSSQQKVEVKPVEARLEPANQVEPKAPLKRQLLPKKVEKEKPKNLLNWFPIQAS